MCVLGVAVLTVQKFGNNPESVQTLSDFLEPM